MQNKLQNIISEALNLAKTRTDITFNSQELYDCTFIKKGKYLPVDVFFDTSFTYEYLNIAPSLLIRNGYDNQDEFIPIPICNDPYRYNHHDLKITLKDYYILENFVAKNCELLLKITHDEIDLFSDFLWKDILNENKLIISEMAQIRPSQSGLKKKIWLDDGGTFAKGGHWLRVKVQDIGNNSHNWPTLTIPDYKWVGATNLDNEEQKKVVKYVKINIEKITALLLKKIDIEEYLTTSIKVDNNGNAIKNNEQKEWIYVYDAYHGISVYKHSISPFGYIYSKDGEISLYVDERNKPIIFDKTNAFNYEGKTYASINDKLFLLTTNGELKQI